MLNIDFTVTPWIVDMFSVRQVSMDELTFVIISLRSSLFSLLFYFRNLTNIFERSVITSLLISPYLVSLLLFRTPDLPHTLFFFCKGKHSRVLKFVHTPLFVCCVFHFSPQTSCFRPWRSTDLKSIPASSQG